VSEQTWLDIATDMREEMAERAVIACILMDAASIVDAMDRVSVADFADPFLGKAYEIALEMFGRRVPADLVTLSGALVDAGYEDAPLDLNAVGAWGVSSSHHIFSMYMRFYADRVARLARVRRFVADIPKKVHELSSDPTAEPSTVLSSWLGEIEVGYHPDDPGPQRLDSMMESVADMLDRKRSGEIISAAIPTPWPSLNQKLGGGIEPGELCVIASRPSIGKTVCSSQILFEAALYGTAIMFSAEMTHASIVQRMLACESGIPFSKIIKPEFMNEGEYDVIQSYLDGLAPLPVYIDDLSGITTDQMMARVQTLQRDGEVAMMVFDYLELAGDNANSQNQEARLSQIAKAMKHIARRLHIPVVVLAQLSREVERRNPPVPRLADLRYSGAIEQVADKVIMLYRPQYYVQQGVIDPNPETENLIEFYIHKNRNGETGKVPLHYSGPILRISEPETTGYQYTQGGLS
jgi:replicative DNA helicase